MSSAHIYRHKCLNLFQRPHSKDRQTACCHREGPDAMNCTNEDKGAYFWTVCPQRHSWFSTGLHTRKLTVEVVWESLWGKLRSSLLSHLCMPGQSLCPAVVLVRLSVLESYKNCQPQPPGFDIWEVSGFQTLFSFWQAFHLKHTIASVSRICDRYVYLLYNMWYKEISKPWTEQ